MPMYTSSRLLKAVGDAPGVRRQQKRKNAVQRKHDANLQRPGTGLDRRKSDEDAIALGRDKQRGGQCEDEYDGHGSPALYLAVVPDHALSFLFHLSDRGDWRTPIHSIGRLVLSGRHPAMRARFGSCGRAACAVVLTLLVIAVPCVAAEADVAAVERSVSSPPEQGVALKLTPTYYHSTSEQPAWDINLRGTRGAANAWVGFNRQGGDFQQLRLGYDYAWDAPFGKLMPSVQYATHGFWGGSLNAEIGDRYFALLGFGRTNLKPYFNLNFDPNDVLTFGVGTRVVSRATLSLYQVRDDRLHTGQRITHLIARYKPDEQTRWTLGSVLQERP